MKQRQPLDPERTPSEQELTELFDALGPREEVPPGILDEMEVATRHAWQQQLWRMRQQRRRRTVAVGLLAAAAALLIFFGYGAIERSLSSGSDQAPVVASIERIEGQVRSVDTESTLDVGAELRDGATLEADADSGAALRLANDVRVRVAPSTRLSIGRDGRLELSDGSIYIETGGAASSTEGSSRVRVETALGVATDLGTRFLVEARPTSTVVVVREGQVKLSAGGDSQIALARQQLVVDRQGRYQLSEASPNGERWSWVLDLASPFELENKTLAQYLDWLSSETGYEIRFASPEQRAALSGIQLHGSIEGERPSQTIDDILLGAGLASTLEDGVLSIFDAQ